MVFHRNFNNMNPKRVFFLPEEEEGDVKKKFVENVVGEILRKEKVLVNISQLLIDFEHLKNIVMKDKKS